MAARVRRLNDLGFAVDELVLEPGGEGRVRVRVAVTNRRFHAAEFERLTGIRALEGQARLLLNDLREYGAWMANDSGVPVTPSEAARRWLAAVYEPTIARLGERTGPPADPVQAYCDVLETKWLLSERERRDVGLQAAIAAYLAAQS